MTEKMVDFVTASAAHFPTHIAYDFMGTRVTYQKFVKQIEEAARSLAALGVHEDDVVCVAMPNMPQAIILIYAANRLGAAVNMIHPLSSENEILDFVNRVDAKTILVLDRLYESIRNIRAGTSLQHIIVAGVGEVLPPVKRLACRLKQGAARLESAPGVLSWQEFLRGGAAVTQLPESENCAEKTALILHSGGTTGKVKGVCLSNRSVNASARQMAAANPMLTDTDRFLSVMPIFHGNGLVIGVHTILMTGARCVLIPRFTPESYARDLLKTRCNYMSGVPALFERLMEVQVMQHADLSFLKGVFSGADSLSVVLEHRINEFLFTHGSPVPVRQGYGMTEGVVATTLNPADRQKEGSVGTVLPGVAAKIVSPGTEDELPCGAVGEIVFSSETNMTGYYHDAVETEQTLRLHTDGRYWVHSGDLGCVDEDGFFYFKGRIKRMIVKNGYNIYPNELENTMEGFPMVDRCCIVDVPVGEGSRKLKAFLVLKDGYAENEQTRGEIMALCRKSIAKYALPQELHFLPELPKTKVGKVDYAALTRPADNP